MQHPIQIQRELISVMTDQLLEIAEMSGYEAGCIETRLSLDEDYAAALASHKDALGAMKLNTQINAYKDFIEMLEQNPWGVAAEHRMNQVADDLRTAVANLERDAS